MKMNQHERRTAWACFTVSLHLLGQHRSRDIIDPEKYKIALSASSGTATLVIKFPAMRIGHSAGVEGHSSFDGSDSIAMHCPRHGTVAQLSISHGSRSGDLRKPYRCFPKDNNVQNHPSKPSCRSPLNSSLKLGQALSLSCEQDLSSGSCVLMP